MPPEDVLRAAEHARTTSAYAVPPEYVLRAPEHARTTLECAVPAEYLLRGQQQAESSAPSAHLVEAQPPATAPAAITPALDAAHPMFLRAALDAYQRGESVTGPLRLDTASLWGVLLACASLVLAR